MYMSEALPLLALHRHNSMKAFAHALNNKSGALVKQYSLTYCAYLAQMSE